MFSNATISSRSSSSQRSAATNSCGRNSSMPSLRMRNPLSPKTSYNPLFRHSDALTSFDASHFVFQEHQQNNNKREKRNPILRRYNSHDCNSTGASSSTTNTNTTNFDSGDGSGGGGGGGSSSKDNTPDSTKSRLSEPADIKKHHQDYEARDFLERYSLPRVVRVGGGEPLLLYRCFDSFTKIQARGIFGRKGKERTDGNILQFPEGYPGWFSLTNEKGEKSAMAHTTILQLVREQVCSFISMQPFTAYATQSTDLTDGNGKVQYLKTQARAGQLFQLRAVFQHKDRPDGSGGGFGGGKNSTRASRVPRSARDKDLSNRYAQLVSQNNQELYVPLTAKGEFYEIHSSMKERLCFPGMLDKTGPLALDKDCLYKITHLLRRVALPVKVKLISGPLPQGLPKDFTDTFVLENKFQEPLMVTCTLPPPNQDLIHHQISCINLNSSLRISKSILGFDSENRLFKSQRLQAALAYCHKNVESWYREVRIAPDLKPDPPPSAICCVHCRKNCDGSCTDKPTQVGGAEPEDNDSDVKQIITKEALDKFPKTKKWYKFKLLGGVKHQETTGSNATQFSDLKDPMDGMEKGKSIERYKDMSKLIEEKFGRKSYNPVKKSASFMFSTKRIDLEETHINKNNPALLKCQSLDTQLYSIDENHRNMSDNLSYDFQMCILDEHQPGGGGGGGKQLEGQSLNDLRPPPMMMMMKKSKPDLIPTLPKPDPEHSFITERLCSEFHVKTKVQKKTVGRHHQQPLCAQIKKAVPPPPPPPHQLQQRSSVVVVQVHEARNRKNRLVVDDVPYSHVADEVCPRPSGRKNSGDENIYAEICDSSAACTCDNKMCECGERTGTTDGSRKKDGGGGGGGTNNTSEYCYVKLGSNGESVQSDSDEAIYNTLR